MYFEKKISTCNVCYSDEARTLLSTEAAVHVSAPAKSLLAVRKIPRLRLQQSLRCFTSISFVSNTCIVFQSHSRERAWTENIALCVGPLILHVLTFNSETSFGWLPRLNLQILNYSELLGCCIRYLEWLSTIWLKLDLVVLLIWHVVSDLSQIALPDDFHDVNTLYTCSSRYICVKLLWV